MSKECISKTILVSRNAYFYLDRLSRIQRGCKPLTVQQEEKFWKSIYKINGKAQLSDNSMGGGDGTYYGKWWSWNVETLKRMLDDGGFKYQEGEDLYYFHA